MLGGTLSIYTEVKMPANLTYEYLPSALCPSAVPRARGVMLVDEFGRIWAPNGSSGHTRLDDGPLRVSGELKVGAVLTATLTGGFATGFQWYRSGVAISGATDLRNGGTQSVYTLVSADVAAGVEITVRPTGFVPVASAGIAAAIAPTTAAPTLTGSPTVGTPLAYAQGAVTGAPAPTVTMSLKIGGETKSLPYTPVASDADKLLELTQSVSNVAGSVSASVSSYVAASVVAPTVSSVPAIIGTPQVGTAVSYTPGTYNGSAATVTRQWTLDGADIAGATSTTYTPTATGQLRVRETATNSAGSVSSTSAAVAVQAAPADTRPRFFVAPANAYNTSTQTYLTGATVLTGSAQGGKSGTFNLTTTSGNYGWVAVLASASAAGVRFYDGVGYGGWSGAGLAGNNTGASPDPATSAVTFTDANGTTWRLFRQDYVNANPSSAPYTAS